MGSVMKTLFVLLSGFFCFLALVSSAGAQGDGLNGAYYSSFSIIGNVITFDEGDLVLERTDANIDFWEGVNQYYRWEPIASSNWYGVRWFGAIYIEEAGNYGFGMVSDDGSQLWIDGNLIVDNGEDQWWDWEDNISESSVAGLYPANDSGTDAPFGPLYLGRGFHRIEVRFFESASYDGIELWWLKPGSGASDIPYYGITFHQGGITYNSSTNWEIVPQSVLYTSSPIPLPWLLLLVLDE